MAPAKNNTISLKNRLRGGKELKIRIRSSTNKKGTASNFGMKTIKNAVIRLVAVRWTS
ncbi:hypothetical protein SPHINGO8BC_70033 [Sphingobacterium multivorum]|uniref:Uncharacterized protein n=1 Tax=Sphingobacterium multivorum TaxID=28454 RepID=A0A654DKJ6_SPHMU|nr:hypothetical protein SPHINGO8BC_70033 [Sphingobacterium multivorum]